MIAPVLALLVGGFLFLFLPSSWQSVDRFEEYQGILDSPIREVTIRISPSEEVTFSDEDLIARWQEGLEQLELKKEGMQWDRIFPVSASGTATETVIRTQTGEYTIRSAEDVCVYHSVFRYALNDWENFPVLETYREACLRQNQPAQ